jgi:RNA polymerase sigma-70 factor (ECF subfamily)
VGGTLLDRIGRAQTGDRNAFGELVDEYAGEMYRLAAAIVGHSDAWDVCQETFLMAWKELPRLRSPEAFRSWLRRICVNQSRNWLRQSKRERSSSLEDTRTAQSVSSMDHSQTQGFAVAEARAILDGAFAGLSVDQRVVLALHYSMGYSLAETARAIGARPGTAKSRLNAGLRLLRRAIARPPIGVSQEAAQ